MDETFLPPEATDIEPKVVEFPTGRVRCHQHCWHYSSNAEICCHCGLKKYTHGPYAPDWTYKIVF